MLASVAVVGLVGEAPEYLFRHYRWRAVCLSLHVWLFLRT